MFRNNQQRGPSRSTASTPQPVVSTRRLPLSAVTILSNWFDAHEQYPYPSEDEKLALVTATGLELRQINDWFINARRRRTTSTADPTSAGPRAPGRHTSDQRESGLAAVARGAGGGGGGSMRRPAPAPTPMRSLGVSPSYGGSSYLQRGGSSLATSSGGSSRSPSHLPTQFTETLYQSSTSSSQQSIYAPTPSSYGPMSYPPQSSLPAPTYYSPLPSSRLESSSYLPPQPAPSGSYRLPGPSVSAYGRGRGGMPYTGEFYADELDDIVDADPYLYVPNSAPYNNPPYGRR